MRCGTMVGLVDGIYQVVHDETVATTGNVIVNPDFETGSVSPWEHTSGFGTDIVISGFAHSGTWCGNISFGESPTQKCYQNIIASKSNMQGRSCTFKIWIKASPRSVPVPGPALKLFIQSNFGNNQTGAYINGNDTWQLYQMTFTANFDNGGTTTYIYIGLQADAQNVFPVRIDDAELIAAAGESKLQVTGLSGDTDNHYKVFARVINQNTSDIKLRFNDDDSSNYGCQEMKLTTAPAVTGARVETDSALLMSDGNLGEASFIEADIYAHSGQERTVLAQSASGIVGSTIGSMRSIAGVYNVPGGELTSIELISSPDYGMGLGSRLLVMKKVELQKGTDIGSMDDPALLAGVWKLVKRDVLDEVRLTYEFIDLDGDTDVIYKLIMYLSSADSDPFEYTIDPGPGTGTLSYATVQGEISSTPVYSGVGSFGRMFSNSRWQNSYGKHRRNSS